ncbi:hypothetical protein AVEN_193401-1 [Araneus ventricosus]|uniref:Reverse transcriptase domain-containing protein n=1 Tax=Araneus ventricosus TaxID=182803 RepID=A0A4Y2FA49_ARAVE|nr:hypothetical protein AVEN_193401-1 [Araneus ventricosus]
MTDFISLNSLHVCNIPELGPYFISTTFGKGNPDMTLISSSFQDGIKPWGILDRLSPSDHKNFIYYYLLDRKVVFKDETLEIERDCHKGCPQGSVVAPNLWNIYVNRVLELNSEKVILKAFADDLALVTTDSVRKELETNTNEG